MYFIWLMLYMCVQWVNADVTICVQSKVFIPGNERTVTGNVAVSQCSTMSLYSARGLFCTCPAGAGGQAALFSHH